MHDGLSTVDGDWESLLHPTGGDSVGQQPQRNACKALPVENKVPRGRRNLRLLAREQLGLSKGSLRAKQTHQFAQRLLQRASKWHSWTRFTVPHPLCGPLREERAPLDSSTSVKVRLRRLRSHNTHRRVQQVPSAEHRRAAARPRGPHRATKLLHPELTGKTGHLSQLQCSYAVQVNMLRAAGSAADARRRRCCAPALSNAEMPDPGKLHAF